MLRCREIELRGGRTFVASFIFFCFGLNFGTYFWSLFNISFIDFHWLIDSFFKSSFLQFGSQGDMMVKHVSLLFFTPISGLAMDKHRTGLRSTVQDLGLRGSENLKNKYKYIGRLDSAGKDLLSLNIDPILQYLLTPMKKDMKHEDDRVLDLMSTDWRQHDLNSTFRNLITFDKYFRVLPDTNVLERKISHNMCSTWYSVCDPGKAREFLQHDAVYPELVRDALVFYRYPCQEFDISTQLQEIKRVAADEFYVEEDRTPACAFVVKHATYYGLTDEEIAQL